MDAANFKLRFPEFATSLDARINLALGDAALSVNSSRWGSKAALGTAYLAAHLLTLQGRGGSGPTGPVTSESVGDLSRSYAAPQASMTGFYGSTTYGLEYLRLRQSIYISPLVL